MSSSNEGAGGGCGFLIMVIAVIAMLAMNPSAAEHKRAFERHHPNISWGVDVLKGYRWADVHYHDWWLFSYVTCKVGDREVQLSAGALGYVYSGE